MCGRYVSVKARTDVVELYDAAPVGPELSESFNVAPTNTVYAVVEHARSDGDDCERVDR